MHHAFLFISLPSLHDRDVKVPNFTFWQGGEHKRSTFFAFSWTSIQSFRIQLRLKNSPTFDEFNYSQRRLLAQHSVAMLQQCWHHSKQCRNNVATLCCAKIVSCNITLKGLVHDNAHVWVLTVADCFPTNRKRVRCTQVNLQNSRAIS